MRGGQMELNSVDLKEQRNQFWKKLFKIGRSVGTIGEID